MLYKIAFFPSEEKSTIANQLRTLMNERGFKESQDDDFEYIFVIGGDGSFLHFSKRYSDQDKKIIGIKKGQTSFLSNFQLEDLNDFESFDWKPMDFLVLKSGDKKYIAGNDICFFGDLLLEAQVSIDGCPLEKFRGSELLVSTQNGSTGKNKSMGGPILMQKERSWLFREIGPLFTNKNHSLGSSIVLSGDNSLRIQVKKRCRVYVDGIFEDELDGEDFEISLQEGNIKTVSVGLNDYISKLRNTFVNNG